jgi:tetratricopeptide (TPR) repeat protein
VGESKEAMECYSRSLALEGESAVVFANRAMAFIRLDLFDLAEEDSSAAILLDPNYVKAYSRRGLVRFKRGKYCEVDTIIIWW